MERSFLSIEGLKISFVELRPELDKTLFFFHGNSNSADLWHFQLADTRFDQYRIVAFDLPGHGQSEICADVSVTAFGITMSQFVLRLINHKPFALIGLSLGGNIIAEMLPHLPKPTAVVIISAAIVGNQISPASIKATELSSTVLFTDLATDNEIRFYFDSALQADIKNQKALLLSDYLSTNLSFRKKLGISITEKRYSNEIMQLQKSEIPCLVVAGLKDETVQHDLLENADLPLWNKQIYKFGGAGHFVNLDQPAKFNQLLLSYLQTRYNHV